MRCPRARREAPEGRRNGPSSAQPSGSRPRHGSSESATRSARALACVAGGIAWSARRTSTPRHAGPCSRRWRCSAPAPRRCWRAAAANAAPDRGPDWAERPVPRRRSPGSTSPSQQRPGCPRWPTGCAPLATRLHSAVASPAENLTLSPLSVAVAFGMLRAGARGETARRLDELFGFPADSRPEGSPHEGFNAVTAALLSPPPPAVGRGPAPVVEIANALFVSPAFGPSVQRPFVDLLARHYDAHAMAVDFASPGAKQTMDAGRRNTRTARSSSSSTRSTLRCCWSSPTRSTSKPAGRGSSSPTRPRSSRSPRPPGRPFERR